jgi:hypothetical protein
MILNLRKIMQWTRFIERKTTFNENYGTCRHDISCEILVCKKSPPRNVQRRTYY